MLMIIQILVILKIFGKRTFLSIRKLVFREKRAFYLFYYNTIFKDRVSLKIDRVSLKDEH